jgi:hypothetical protein
MISTEVQLCFLLKIHVILKVKNEVKRKESEPNFFFSFLERCRRSPILQYRVVVLRRARLRRVV